MPARYTHWVTSITPRTEPIDGPGLVTGFNVSIFLCDEDTAKKIQPHDIQSSSPWITRNIIREIPPHLRDVIDPRTYLEVKAFEIKDALEEKNYQAGIGKYVPPEGRILDKPLPKKPFSLVPKNAKTFSLPRKVAVNDLLADGNGFLYQNLYITPEQSMLGGDNQLDVLTNALDAVTRDMDLANSFSSRSRSASSSQGTRQL